MSHHYAGPDFGLPNDDAASVIRARLGNEALPTRNEIMITPKSSLEFDDRNNDLSPHDGWLRGSLLSRSRS